MANETVLVSEAGMDGHLRDLVKEACSRAKVRHVFWDGMSPEGADRSASPSLLVASIAAGTREIPEPLANVVTKAYPGVPLLLLCDEALIRQSVTLQSGRVTLLGTPLNLEKISSRIRTALAAGPDEEGARDGRSAIGHGVQEYRGPHWWGASLAKESGDESDNGDDVRPVVHNSKDLGFAVTVPARSSNRSSYNLERIAPMLRSGLPEDRLAEALKDEMNCLLWLSPGAKGWTFYCTGDIYCALVSSRRLPRYWNVSQRLQKTPVPIRSVAASSGDLVILGRGLEKLLSVNARGQLAPETVERIADGGGPSLLDLFDSRHSEWPDGFSAVVVEVR